MSGAGDSAYGASTGILGTPLRRATSARKRLDAPKVITSSIASTEVKRGAQPVDTPRPGHGTSPAS